MLKSFWFWCILLLMVIQMIPIDVPTQLNTQPKNEIDAPKEIQSILKRSCYDCHSSSVNYPWYDTIAPISWFVKNHVKNGRRVVNFSTWKSYPKSKQLEVMRKLPKSLVVRMPMPSYLWLHPASRLSDQEKRQLIQWAEALENGVK